MTGVRRSQSGGQNSGTLSNLRPFRPGQSGNPGGRPRGLARITRERVGGDGEAIVQFWLDVMHDPSWRGSERLRASELLAERGWGRAPQFAPVEDDDPLGTNQEDVDAAVARFSAEVGRLTALRDADGDRG